MGDGFEKLPEEIEVLQAALVVARAEVAIERARRSDDQALIAHLKLQIEKLNRDRYGPRSERAGRLLDQLELTLEELEASATQDELAAEMAAVKATNATTTVASFERKRPSRKPFPDHLPRERVMVPGPTACGCCGGARLSRLGEDITETLEVIPKSWKVIQHVREKFTCRDCEKISQAPAPFHVILRGWAGPSLLAMVLFEKFGQHQPLNRQAERYAKEGVPISLSTLADQVGGCTAALTPLFKRLEAYVLSAARLHGDDTTVPVLAKGKTDTGRIWIYVRDDKPFGGPEPAGAVFYYSRDRAGEHPQAHLANYSGILQADAYGGYGRLLSLGVEFSLNVGAENSLAGVLAWRTRAHSGPPGDPTTDHCVRHDSDGGSGGPAWRIDDDFGSSPPGTFRDCDSAAHGTRSEDSSQIYRTRVGIAGLSSTSGRAPE